MLVSLQFTNDQQGSLNYLIVGNHRKEHMPIQVGMMKSPGYKATRAEILEELKQYFLQNLCEDQHEGSKFDCDVLDAIKTLQEEYPEE